MANTTTPSTPDDVITTVVAHHPICGRLSFARVRQDRRTYYQLQRGGSAGCLTDRAHAEQTIAYWRSKGWIVNE